MTKLAEDHRRRELATIHVAKKQLLDRHVLQSDDDYRSLLWTLCRVRSAADLDHAGRRTVIDHLKKLGFKETSGKSTSRPVKRALLPKHKLMWSLWQQLADAGKVTDRRMPALLAYVKRQTTVERLEWLNEAQNDLVVESLKLWLGRKP